ncbi:chromodomain-helicase-DNA-binding protein 2 isoform X2 [Cimex lectularius]|uniref:Chromo domain-containing protein n=1 Tax=Cimex lectularius TaxID=79782 RepID=A0A8I6TJ44_CIMLE|nr:chromodomain-helicase-DNA-binding protein 2 isoform X2 [Cimex lectularius]
MRVYVGNDSSETNRKTTRKPIEPEMSEDDSQEEVKMPKTTRRTSKKLSEPEEPKVATSGKRRGRQSQNDDDLEVESSKKSTSFKKSKTTSEATDGEEDKDSASDEESENDGDNEDENMANGEDMDSKDLKDAAKENYEVEKLVSSRVKNGKTQYKVHWKGYNSSQDTWENESNLSCDELIEQYLNTQKKKKVPGSMQQNGEWEVLKIVDMHIFKTGKREFLVRWKGFGPKDDTWEPEDNLKHTNLLNRYLAKLEEVKSIPLKDLRIKRQQTDRLTYMPQGVQRRESKRYRNKQRIRYYDD